MQNSIRLVLGTAQLGMPYGIANKTGQPDLSTSQAIIREAWEHGIREFDTAQSYGKSVGVLGYCLSQLGISKDALVISKFDPRLNHLSREELSNALDESLALLHVSKLAGIMLHREEHLDLWEKGLKEIILGFVKEGRVGRVGVSVYSPKKALRALETAGIDMVQLPTNILDRRFVDAGVFDLARKKAKELYIRSVFLQGLLLMDPEQFPVKMNNLARPILERFQSFAKGLNLTRQEVALGYVKMQFPEAKIIFGAEAISQIKENVNCWNSNLPQKLVKQLHQAFESVDVNILNPVLWAK